MAFGKGLGFQKVPYELKDLNRISMTFYKLNYHYYQLLKEIPTEIFNVSAAIVQKAQKIIPRDLNPNIIFSLADHINFAITRASDYQGAQLPFSYDIEQLYPEESKVGHYAIKLINDRLKVNLTYFEVTAITMHFVNSQVLDKDVAKTAHSDDAIIEQAAKIIEQEFDIKVDRNGFAYNRFTMHLRYYIKRIYEKSQLAEDDDMSLFHVMKQNEPEIYVCAKRIATYIDDELESKSTNNEIFYLMIYIKRIIDR